MGRHCSETENQLDVIKIGDIIILTQIMGRMGWDTNGVGCQVHVL